MVPLAVVQLRSFFGAAVAKARRSVTHVFERFCQLLLDRGRASLAAGGSPAATYFFCAAKRSRQEKAAPVRRPLIAGDPAILDASGACATRPRHMQEQDAASNRCSARSPDASAFLGVAQGGVRSGGVASVQRRACGTVMSQPYARCLLSLPVNRRVSQVSQGQSARTV